MWWRAKLLVAFAILIVVACSKKDSPVEQGGELVWVQRGPGSSEHLVPVAKRVFRDASGRTVKTVTYEIPDKIRRRVKPGSHFREKDLKPFRIMLHTHDANSLREKIEYRSPDGNLLGTATILSKEDHQSTTIIHYDSKGIRTWEQRVTANSKTTLRFDAEGETVVLIEGDLLPDIDLAYGWGTPMNGLSCGIAPTRLRGRMEEIGIWISVKNDQDESAPCFYPIEFLTFKMDLRDSSGRRQLPQEERYKASHPWTLRPDGSPTLGQIPAYASTARQRGIPYMLKDWYGDLAPGTYTVTVEFRTTGEEFSLVSNKLILQIEP